MKAAKKTSNRDLVAKNPLENITLIKEEAENDFRKNDQEGIGVRKIY